MSRRESKVEECARMAERLRWSPTGTERWYIGRASSRLCLRHHGYLEYLCESFVVTVPSCIPRPGVAYFHQHVLISACAVTYFSEYVDHRVRFMVISPSTLLRSEMGSDIGSYVSTILI